MSTQTQGDAWDRFKAKHPGLARERLDPAAAIRLVGWVYKRFERHEARPGGSALALLEWAGANPDEARKLRAGFQFDASITCASCGNETSTSPCHRCGTDIPIEEAK